MVILDIVNDFPFCWYGILLPLSLVHDCVSCSASVSPPALLPKPQRWWWPWLKLNCTSQLAEILRSGGAFSCPTSRRRPARPPWRAPAPTAGPPRLAPDLPDPPVGPAPHRQSWVDTAAPRAPARTACWSGKSPAAAAGGPSVVVVEVGKRKKKKKMAASSSTWTEGVSPSRPPPGTECGAMWPPCTLTARRWWTGFGTPPTCPRWVSSWCHRWDQFNQFGLELKPQLRRFRWLLFSYQGVDTRINNFCAAQS